MLNLDHFKAMSLGQSLVICLHFFAFWSHYSSKIFGSMSKSLLHEHFIRISLSKNQLTAEKPLGSNDYFFKHCQYTIPWNDDFSFELFIEHIMNLLKRWFHTFVYKNIRHENLFLSQEKLIRNCCRAHAVLLAQAESFVGRLCWSADWRQNKVGSIRKLLIFNDLIASKF